MKPAREIVLIYAVFAALWILLSDTAVEWLFRAPAQIVLANTLKGWFFVVVTSLLLYGLLRHVSDTENVGAGETVRISRLPLALLVVAIVTLTGGGIAHTAIRHQERETARLQTIADLKARQIADWLKERQDDAEFLQSNAYLAEQYLRWRAGEPANGEHLKASLEQFRQSRGFAAVTLLDPDGRRLWGGTDAPRAAAPPLTAATREARDGGIRRVGPYRDAADRVRLDFIVPLKAAAAPFPLIVLHVDVHDWLYPALQNWPAPTISGETILFRRDGDAVLFLNDLRYRDDTAIKLRIPLADRKLLAAQVLRGEAAEGRVVFGHDYRDVATLGVAHAIRGTDWFMIAKLDQAELHAEAAKDSVWIGLAGLLALFVAGAGYYLLRQRSQLELAGRIREAQNEKLRALQLLNAIADSSDDAIFAKDADGRYLLYNRAAGRFSGKTAEAVGGRDDYAIFPPEVADRIRAIDREIMAADAPRRFEEEIPHDGGSLTVEVDKMPLHDETGKVVGLFGIARDISERRRAEATLRESEERFHQIFDNMSSGVVVYTAVDDGADFIFHDLNPAAERIEGIARGELLGRRVTAAFPSIADFGLLAVMQRVWRTGAAEHHPVKHYQDDRIAGWRENYVCRLPSGEIVAIYDDITEQKRAEESLGHSERRFHDIVKASADWIWEVDVEGRYTYASESVQDLLGYTPEEILGKTPFDLMPPDEAARVRAEFMDIAARHAPFRDLDNINVHKDGSLRHILTNGTPILGTDGRLYGYRGLDHDVTERKQAETALRQLTDDMAATLQAIPDLLFELDGEGRYLTVKAAQESLLAAPAERLQGSTVHAALPPEAARTMMDAIGAASRAGTDYGRTIMLPLAHGPSYFELSVARKLASEGRHERYVVLARDITARQAAEEELRSRNAELERFNSATIGRELDMIELKKQVNALSRELGREPPYPLAFLNNETEGRP